MSRPTYRLLFLGTGTQSSTVMLLACGGRLPRPDAAKLADTGREPTAASSGDSNGCGPRNGPDDGPAHAPGEHPRGLA